MMRPVCRCAQEPSPFGRGQGEGPKASRPLRHDTLTPTLSRREREKREPAAEEGYRSVRG